MSIYTIDTSTSRANPTPEPMRRLTVPKIQAMKGGEPIVMLTAYTARMAQLLDPHCDMLLVGDSLGQVIYGLPSTIPVTLEMMCAHGAAAGGGAGRGAAARRWPVPVTVGMVSAHGAAVVRGCWHALVAVDMPFGSYEGSPEQAFQSAARIMQETGCAAVKLEGGEAMAPTISFLSERGVPVI